MYEARFWSPVNFLTVPSDRVEIKIYSREAKVCAFNPQKIFWTRILLNSVPSFKCCVVQTFWGLTELFMSWEQCAWRAADPDSNVFIGSGFLRVGSGPDLF